MEIEPMTGRINANTTDDNVQMNVTEAAYAVDMMTCLFTKIYNTQGGIQKIVCNNRKTICCGC